MKESDKMQTRKNIEFKWHSANMENVTVKERNVSWLFVSNQPWRKVASLVFDHLF